VGSNSEIQGYNVYSMLHFYRKFSSGITLVVLCGFYYTGKRRTSLHTASLLL